MLNCISNTISYKINLIESRQTRHSLQLRRFFPPNEVVHCSGDSSELTHCHEAFCWKNAGIKSSY